MTVADFQKTRGPWLKTILTSTEGTDLLNALNSLKPALPDSFPTEHSMTRGYAKIEGYELCLRHMVALTMIPKPSSQPEANYGVPDKKTE